MKTFTKTINACKDCPNIGYIHYDGEGTSSPREFNRSVCMVTDSQESAKQKIMGKYYDGRFMARYIPDKNLIPDWCPL